MIQGGPGKMALSPLQMQMLENYIQKKVLLDKYFSIVHISLNFVFTNLKFLVAVDDI